MTVTTARRSEIVRSLQRLRGDLASSSPYYDPITEAIEIIEGRGVPFDEIAKLPSARRTDPDTSHEFVLVVGEAHRRLLAVYAVDYSRTDVPPGLTPDEAAAEAGMQPGVGPRKRISELKRSGLLADSGGRRPSMLNRPQQVLMLTEHGSNEAMRLGVVEAG